MERSTIRVCYPHVRLSLRGDSANLHMQTSSGQYLRISGVTLSAHGISTYLASWEEVWEWGEVSMVFGVLGCFLVGLRALR